MAPRYAWPMAIRRGVSGRQQHVDMTKEQRAELVRRYKKVQRAEAALPVALDERDAYYRELRDAGIYPTQIAEVLSEALGESIDRTHISKMIRNVDHGLTRTA